MLNHVFLAILSLFTLAAVLAYAAWEIFGVRRHQRRTNDVAVKGEARTTTGAPLFTREPEKEELVPGQDIGRR